MKAATAGENAPTNARTASRGLLCEPPRRIEISQKAHAIPNAISKNATIPFL
jgi:hypothetical protein